MKTSKRLLSILLMLTMLVSMFTVMAFADNTETATLSFEIAGNGKIVLRKPGEPVFSREVTQDFTMNSVPVDFLQSLEVVAVADGGYTGKLYLNNSEISGGSLTMTAISGNYSFKAVFTEKEDSTTTPEPEQPKPTSVDLKIQVVAPNVKDAKILLKGNPVSLDKYIAVWSDDLERGITLDASATGEYKVSWDLNGSLVSSGKSYKLPSSLSDQNTLTATFEAVTVGHKLTINVEPEGAGTVNANPQKLEALPKGTEIKLTATPEEGYKFKEWKVTSGDAIVNGNEKATVRMGDTDATITAVFEKKAAPAEYKLKIDRNNTKGSISFRTKTGNSWGSWTTIKAKDYPYAIKDLKTGTKVQIQATPDSGCVATWMIDRVFETVKDNTYTVTIDDADISVYVMFQKKVNSDRELDLDISGWKHGEIKYRVNNGTKYTLTSSDYPFTLEEGDKITFYIDADSDYTAKWNLDKESKSYSDEFTVRYKDIDEDGSTLHISFVKKSTVIDNDYPTLTFDITGGKHGTVYRGTREYEDGDVISIKKNDKMTFKAKADKGYVAVWTYKGDTYVGDEYTVKMGANDAKLYVEFMDKDDIRLTELPFRDVSKRDWYYDDVVYVYRKGYMDGMSSTRFGGELNTTRGQIVTILWRLTGEPRATRNNPFNDVSSRQYYYDAISWAYDAGVVDGFDARTFKPDQNVTREQLAAILYRYAKYMNLSTSGSAYLAKYKDADKIANWAYDAMAWANYRGLINGTSATRIDPKGYATRAQIAAILHRFAVEFGA